MRKQNRGTKGARERTEEAAETGRGKTKDRSKKKKDRREKKGRGKTKDRSKKKKDRREKKGKEKEDRGPAANNRA
ncbi:MAG: hypothetical protein B5M48_03195, partial [Candidatus Omnitrophica bacterium 4484_213]